MPNNIFKNTNYYYYYSSQIMIYIYIYVYVCVCVCVCVCVKSKGVPRQDEVALGVPGRLRPQIISTFGTTRVVVRQPYAPAAFTPG